MDGKLLVLCGERPTVDEYEERLDEQGRSIYKKTDGTYVNGENKVVTVDTHKNVISATKLQGPIITPYVNDRDMLFVDWETVIPSDIEVLRQAIAHANTTEEVPYKFFLDASKRDSIMQQAYLNRLSEMIQTGDRPRVDFQFLAMEDFMQQFTRLIEKIGVVRILPTYPNQDDSDINMARAKLITAWGDRNRMHAHFGEGTSIEVLPPVMYNEFGEIYAKAEDEMLKIISAPFWFEKENDEEEHGGRD